MSYLVIRRMRGDGGTWLAASGIVDGPTLARLEAALQQAVGDGTRTIDLSDVDVPSAGGRALLLNTVRRTRFAYPAVRLVIPDGPFRVAVERTGLGRRMAVIDALAAEAANDVGAVLARVDPRGTQPPLRGSTLLRRAALLVDATAAIEAYHADPELNVHQVARRVATSSRQLQRVFADLGATHFRAELTAVRMQHAAELLHGTEPIRLIGARVGCRDPAQFTKVFRRHHGLVPGAFRATVARAPTAIAQPLEARAADAMPGLVADVA